MAAFCTFLPALDAVALTSAAAAEAFFATASLAARAAALASRGDDEPAGAATAPPDSADAEDEAEALGVLAAERSAGVDAREERGVNDFFSDSPSFLERVRFSSARAEAASDIFCGFRKGRELRKVAEEREKSAWRCFLSYRFGFYGERGKKR